MAPWSRAAQVFSKIHGPAGSTVTLQFRAAADGRVYTATLTRAGASGGAPAFSAGSTVRTTWNKQPSSLRVSRCSGRGEGYFCRAFVRICVDSSF